MSHLLPTDKELLFRSLLSIISDLNRSGVVTVQRMCITCSYYRSGSGGQKHFCRLLGQELAVGALRVDCPDHVRPELIERY